MSSDKVYIAIDLKSFYASVECIEQVYLKHVAPEDIHADPIVTITYFVPDKKRRAAHTLMLRASSRRSTSMNGAL